MENVEEKIKMTVVHLAHEEIKPVSSFSETESINTRVLDPSSSIRAERYPIPTALNFRSNQSERDFAYTV